jgi:hypothetical protein
VEEGFHAPAQISGVEHSFPQYRRTATGSNLYRIEAADRFTELQRLGTRWLVHTVAQAPYPEQVRIQEMLDGLGGLYEPETATAFERLLADALAGGAASR